MSKKKVVSVKEDPKKKTTKLAKLMFEKNISSKFIEENTGVAHSTISLIKNGLRPTPDLDTLKKIAKAIGVGVGELID